MSKRFAMAWLACAAVQVPQADESSVLVPLEPATAAVAPRAQRFRIESRILGVTRRVFVATPPTFAGAPESRRFPTLVVTDGEAHSALAVVAAATELGRFGLMPDVVVVGVENAGSADDRALDLTPAGLDVSGTGSNGRGDRFLDFLERELMPAVDREFRTAPPRVFVGHSSGGILATYAAATRDTYRLVVALDTPAQLGDHWLAERLIARARSTPPPLRYASVNAAYGWSGDAWQRVLAAAPPSWRLFEEHTDRETHQSMPLFGAYVGLREVFAEYSTRSAPAYPTTSILPYYDTLTATYGGRVDPPLPLMRTVVEDLLIEGRGAEAAAAFDRLVAIYGPPADAASLRGEIAEVSSRPAPSETVESLLATPFPTPEQAAPLLGIWDVEREGAGGMRSRLEIELKVVDGRVTGMVTMHPTSDSVLERPLDHLVVESPDAFTYGYMNGMRPRGMLLYSVRRAGDGFEGAFRWGGVSPPEGEPGPQVTVRLRKRR